MEVIIIISAVLLVAGVLLWAHDRMSRHRKDVPSTDSGSADAAVSSGDMQPQETEEEECCGMHITCERDSLLAAVSPEIVYYDDEELDRFRGRAADDYTDEEIEEFRDVLLTLLPDDIAGWGRSIQQRDITLPTPIRQELLLIVAEVRESRGVHA
ncbi:phospholipase [uncultured Muribaculum sp.]|uniref:phospholipase n=1 Tax=uncultured Muribaculum sp. TaxID=1918613 RepID=UPI0025D3191B|nr:phospholipase [uncultured Muribaculum sp.]